MRASFWRAALCGMVVVAGGCDDTGFGSDEGSGGSTTLAPPPGADRFAVQVRATGSFRPGQLVQITVTGRANLRTRDLGYAERLARAWRAKHQNIVAAGGGDG